MRKQRKKWMTSLAVLGISAVFWQAPVFAAPGYDQTASSSLEKEIGAYGMTPIYGQGIQDGTYEVKVESSSSFFRIQSAKLSVKEGKMEAVLTMDSTSYRYVYPGTAAEAAAAPLEDYVPMEEKAQGTTFTLSVEALNKEINCASFSKKKEKWYDRILLFDASSLPEDAFDFSIPDYDRIEDAIQLYDEENGTDTKAELAEKAGAGETGTSSEGAEGTSGEAVRPNEGAEGTSGASGISNGISSGTGSVQESGPQPVSMEEADGEYSIEVDMTGGSERASVTSPTWLFVKDGKGYAKLLWSSVYYDYMIVGGKTYLNETTDGSNSTFTIPITALDESMSVIADTTAMGDPVEIEYALTFYSDTVGSVENIPQEAAKKVLVIALAIIILGGILNYFVKKKRYR